MTICMYGCNQEATHQFKNGNWCCGTNTSKCPSIKKAIGEAHVGMFISEKTKEAVRKSRLGKKDSEETRKKKSEARKGEKTPRYGKKASERTKRKISNALKGRKAHNKLTIKYLKERYPFFTKVEELRYNPLNKKEIQVRCRNHSCQKGWFTPTHDQFFNRKKALESEGIDKNSFYCSE